MQRKNINESDFSKFLSREYPSDPLWKSFFKLWLDANGFDYGDNDQHIVDGFGDGGLDAIAYPPHSHTQLPIVVIQSKYFKSKIPTHTLEKFFIAVEVFKSNDKKVFEKWLLTVKRISLRPEYVKLWNNRNNLKFILVTSGSLQKLAINRVKKLKIQLEDRKKIKALFFDMARGKSPRPKELVLRVKGPLVPVVKNKDHGLFIFSAPLSDFSSAFLKHKNNLFAGNVRYAIRGDTSKGVRSGIKETLETRPEEFAYFHNGITIVCKKIIKKKNSVVLISPSIVNGAQTVSYVGETLSDAIPIKATVLVKAIEVTAEGGFEEFETDVAMSSNTQNKVSLSDLSVIDPDLVSIERYFRASKAFLERKKGDRPLGKAFIKINKDRLLQLFACLDSKTGPASPKDKQNLYRSHSGRLFSQYSSNIQSKKDAVFLAALDKLVRDSLLQFKLSGKSGQRKKRRLSLSYFTIFSIIAKLIYNSKQWRSVRSAFLDEGIWNNQYSIALSKDVKMTAAVVLSSARKDSDKNETAFFKNREKVNNLISKIISKYRHKTALKKVL